MKLLSTCLLGLLLFFSPVDSQAQSQQVAPALTAKTDSVKTDSAKADSAKAGVSGNTGASSEDDGMPFALILAIFFLFHRSWGRYYRRFCCGVISAFCICVGLGWNTVRRNPCRSLQKIGGGRV